MWEGVQGNHCSNCNSGKVVDIFQEGVELKRIHPQSLSCFAQPYQVLRCYCSWCGIMYHPGTVGVNED